MKIKVKMIAVNGGYNVKANGSVNVTFVTAYSELTNIIQAQQLLNNDVSVKIRVPSSDGKADVFSLGLFRVHQTIIDNDGEAKLKLNGLSDYIEMDNLYKLPNNTEDICEFNVLLESEV